MLIFLRTSDGPLLYLLNNKQYSVGRKACDIFITDDQSISRKHAILTVKDDSVTVTDCGSRYNTFVDKTKIESGVEVALSKGNVIQFGMLKSIYTFEETSIVTTTSSIKSDQKANLRNNINFLRGSLQQNWTSQCTHVTVEEIMLTAKVLCAVIQGIPIVKLKYWDDYVSNVKQNLAPPNAADYVPSCSETILNKNVSLEYKETRKELFSNKTFVFPTKAEKVKIVDMIVLAGGEAISWDTNPLTREDVHNSSKEYIILQTSELTDQKMSSDHLDFINYYTQTGKRTIPLQEIALAIVKCSCEKDCNPDFDRKGTVLASATQTQFQRHTENVLALPTQSQSLIPAENVKTEIIIPHSLETDLDTVSIDKMEIGEELLKSNRADEVNSIDETKNSQNEIEIPSSIKRESEPIDNHMIAPKKMKMESTSFSSKKNDQKKNTVDNLEHRVESVQEGGGPSGRTLFAFKKNKCSNETSISANENSNPFSKKRKFVQSDSSENPPKKNASVNDTSSVPSTSFGSTSKSANALRINPFSNILKAKNFTPTNSTKTSQSSSLSTAKTTRKSKNIMVDESANSLQVDSSKITVVDSRLEKSYGWILKSSNHTTYNKESTINGDTSAIDEELLKYIESFKNSVVIDDEREKICRKPTVVDNNNDATVANNNLKNFKKFIKVQPLKIQTTIIPEASYVDVICNHNCAIEVVRADSENDSSDDAIDSQVNVTKRRGKRYEF